MRTTVDLPEDVFRAAKAHAAARGETLKEFLTRAVTHELGSAVAPRKHTRVALPLVKSKAKRRVNITNEDIEAIFAAEDAEKYGNP
jgi:hypothetical protein